MAFPPSPASHLMELCWLMSGLSVSNLEVVYHKRVIAVRGISLEVADGKIVALFGLNGAGKTTTLRAIAGLLPGDNAEVTDGQIEYHGKSLVGLEPHVVVRQGIVLVPEREKIFETLTVRENLLVPVAREQTGAAWAEEVLAMFPILRERGRQLAGSLSGGERQMLALARALLCRPRMLLVDELTLGLAPKIALALLGCLRDMRERLGVGMLLVEQNVAAALEIADYGYVMEHGRLVFHGTPDRLRTQEDVRESYLGLATAGVRSYREVKQYRRTRRWWG